MAGNRRAAAGGTSSRSRVSAVGSPPEIWAFHTRCRTSARLAQPLNSLGRPAGPAPSPPGPVPGLPCSFVEERYEAELTRAAAVLDGVDRALERLSDGTYGQCETCGAPVLEADLERDPTRRMCEQHLTLTC